VFSSFVILCLLQYIIKIKDKKSKSFFDKSENIEKGIFVCLVA